MDPKDLLNAWLNDIGVRHGKALLDDLKGKPKDVVLGALADVAQLRAQELAGIDIGNELQFAETTLLNMGAAVSIKVQRTVLQVLRDSADMAGSALIGLINTVLAKIG